MQRDTILNIFLSGAEGSVVSIGSKYPTRISQPQCSVQVCCQAKVELDRKLLKNVAAMQHMLVED